MNSPFNFLNNKNQYEDVVKYGTYYFPANKHYYKDTVVQCDNCLKHKLTACIGYKDHDLCLACADRIESQISSRSSFPSISISEPRFITNHSIPPTTTNPNNNILNTSTNPPANHFSFGNSSNIAQREYSNFFERPNTHYMQKDNVKYSTRRSLDDDEPDDVAF